MDARLSKSQNKRERSLSPPKKRPRNALSASEKVMINNVYKYVFKEKRSQLEDFEKFESPNIDDCVTKVAEILGISKGTVYCVLKENRENKDKPPKPPKKPGRKKV